MKIVLVVSEHLGTIKIGIGIETVKRLIIQSETKEMKPLKLVSKTLKTFMIVISYAQLCAIAHLHWCSRGSLNELINPKLFANWAVKPLPLFHTCDIMT